MKALVETAWRAATDLVFPRSCVACAGVVEENDYRHLCPRCAAQLAWVSTPGCETCGHPFYGAVGGEAICVHCQGLDPAFRRGRTAVLCRGPARALIHELKYRRGLHVLEDFETIFRRCPAVLEICRGAVLVPVPLHRRKFRERGYNQSALIAEALVRASDDAARVGFWLERQVDTISQTGFDRRARQENLKNAFALAVDADIKTHAHIVLVDDVFTTGSTLNGCARVLRRAGCLNLDVVTFGHG